jgi:hypothetical protein
VKKGKMVKLRKKGKKGKKVRKKKPPPVLSDMKK